MEVKSNKEVEAYLETLSKEREERIRSVINYIRESYPQAKESLDYAPKTKIPTFKIQEVYVAVANTKHHVSIHFGKYGATEIVAKANPKIVKRIGCVNIPDSVVFPIDEVRLAIDYCFRME